MSINETEKAVELARQAGHPEKITHTDLAIAEGDPDLDMGISVEHFSDGSVRLIVATSGENPRGVSVLCTAAQRYDLADMILNPNGNGYLRSSGKLDRHLATEAEKAQRARDVAKAAEQAGLDAQAR